MKTFVAFMIFTAMIFLIGWLVSCFVWWEWSVPLESRASRITLVLSAFLALWFRDDLK